MSHVSASSAPPASPALAVHGLTRTYGSGDAAINALAGVDLAFWPGTFTAVMGPSGSGKSTFLTCAAGLDRPTSGRIVLDGWDITDWDEEQRTRLRRDQIGFVFQGFHLLPYLTAAQNVALPARLAGRRLSRARVRWLLETVGLAERAHHLPGGLSGGQQQRVAIARAIVGRPRVLLADEPTGNLDEQMRDEIIDLLIGLNNEGLTLIVVTHDSHVARLARRRVRISGGAVKELPVTG